MFNQSDWRVCWAGLGIGVACLTGGVGCSHLSHTERGALAGGGIGAGVGALAGSLVGKAGAGAALGGVAGGLIGSLAGNEEDKAERQQLQAQLVAAQAAAATPPLTLEDIVRMAQSQTSDQVIINQIRTTGSVYRLNAAQIQWLREQGVSDTVILEMQNTATRRPPTVAVAPPPQPIIVHEPTPVIVRPAPVYVVPPRPAFGFTYIRTFP
jgi:surface antigen